MGRMNDLTTREAATYQRIGTTRHGEILAGLRDHVVHGDLPDGARNVMELWKGFIEEQAGGTKFSPDANAAGACRPAVSTVRVMHISYPSHTRG